MLICQISDCEFTNSHLSWKHNPRRFLRTRIPEFVGPFVAVVVSSPCPFFYQDGLLWHLYLGGEGEKRPEKKLSCSAVIGVWDLNLQKEGLFLGRSKSGDDVLTWKKFGSHPPSRPPLVWIPVKSGVQGSQFHLLRRYRFSTNIFSLEKAPPIKLFLRSFLGRLKKLI